MKFLVLFSVLSLIWGCKTAGRQVAAGSNVSSGGTFPEYYNQVLTELANNPKFKKMENGKVSYYQSAQEVCRQLANSNYLYGVSSCLKGLDSFARIANANEGQSVMFACIQGESGDYAVLQECAVSCDEIARGVPDQCTGGVVKECSLMFDRVFQPGGSPGIPSCTNRQGSTGGTGGSGGAAKQECGFGGDAGKICKTNGKTGVCKAVSPENTHNTYCSELTECAMGGDTGKECLTGSGTVGNCIPVGPHNTHNTYCAEVAKCGFGGDTGKTCLTNDNSLGQCVAVGPHNTQNTYCAEVTE